MSIKVRCFSLVFRLPFLKEGIDALFVILAAIDLVAIGVDALEAFCADDRGSTAQDTELALDGAGTQL